MHPVRLSLQIGMPRLAGKVHVPGVAGVMQSVPASLDPALLPVLAPDAPLWAPEPVLAPDVDPLLLAPDVDPLPLVPDIEPLLLAPDFEPPSPDVAALVPEAPALADPLSVAPVPAPEAVPELSPVEDVAGPGLDAQPMALRPTRSNPKRKDDLL
jgi:hypothetical protein